MVKNDINIQPSKGISIIIKNDISQPEQPKPKKKRKYRKRNIKDLLKNIPQIPNGLISSAGDTSYIRPPLSYQQFRDLTTQPGYQMGLLAPQAQPALPPPPVLPALPPPPPQLQLPPPPVTINNNNNGAPADWYKYLMMPQAFTNDPTQQPTIEDVTNDPLYNALSYDPVQQEAYKEQKLEEKSQEIIDKAAETVANIEGTPLFGTLPPTEQNRIREFTTYNEIEKKLKTMKPGSKKSWGTKDANAGRPPRYATDEAYKQNYIGTLENLQEQKQLIIDDATKTRNEKRIAAADKRGYQDLINRLKTEERRIKRILENKP
jgi:hypothetical protein